MSFPKDKPIIGIIGRVIDNKICINDEIRYAVLKSGGIPFIIIPNQKQLYNKKKIKNLKVTEKRYLKKIVNKIDGLLLQGGNTWHQYDEYIYKYALKKNIPILGICMGMQMICKIDVTNSKKNDNLEKNLTYINHNQTKKYVHKVRILNNTNLSKIIKKDIIYVNSRHNYHVKKVNNLSVTAYSNDGFIEGVEYKNKKFVIGVEWHPESTFDNDAFSKRLFKSFIKSCKKNINN